ncbi:MAG: hypothetical protein H6876_06845 [Hyphomicrobiaceae bacterium]|nr:hypothetical protein [Hyphomicrobiaceae bacterium]
MAVNALMAYSHMTDPVDTRTRFWSDPTRWPQDAGGFIFAAKALQKLGRRLLPSEWSDHSPLTEYIGELPENLWLSTPRSEIERGVRILRQSETSYTRRVGLGGGLFANMSECEFPTTEEWAEAVRLVRVAREQSWPLLLPFLKTEVALWHACLEGKIKSATRGYNGGEIEEREWHFWNYELAWARFDLCRVDPSQPHLSGAQTRLSDWIFIEESSLESFHTTPSPDASLIADATERVRASESKRRRAGRRARYDWLKMATEFAMLRGAGEIDDDVSNSEIANRLLDRFSEIWEELPDKRSVEARVSEWRLI